MSPDPPAHQVARHTGVPLRSALVSLNKASVWIVIVAITIPEVPRVVRLVRSVVLTVREMPYIEAAISGGSRGRKIVLRQILPFTVAPLIGRPYWSVTTPLGSM